jgi:hypothetical protein
MDAESILNTDILIRDRAWIRFFGSDILNICPRVGVLFHYLDPMVGHLQRFFAKMTIARQTPGRREFGTHGIDLDTKMLYSAICVCAQRIEPLFIMQTVSLRFYFILRSCKASLLCLDNLSYSRIMKI